MLTRLKRPLLPRPARVFTLSVSLTVLGTLAVAAVLAGGLYQVIKTLHIGAGGSPLHSGGTYTLSHAVAQPNARNDMTGGGYQVISGYYNLPDQAAPTGEAPEVGIVLPDCSTSNDPAIVCCNYTNNDTRIGCLVDRSIAIPFLKAQMDQTSVLTAVSVAAIQDLNGGPTYFNPQFVGTYDAPTNRLILTPTTTWPPNRFFEIRVANSARSTGRRSLANALTRRFNTIFISTTAQTFTEQPLVKNDPITGLPDPNPQAKVAVPEGALPQGYTVIRPYPQFTPDRADPNTIERANAKIVENYGATSTPFNILEITAYSTDTVRVPTKLTKPATLSIKYTDDGHGFVAGIGHKVPVKKLAIWYLDEQHSLWLKLPSMVDTEHSAVVASLPHFSVYALAGVDDTSVDLTYAFPVPWKPRAGNPTRYGDLTNGIIFAQLPMQGSIRIYTISGSFVKEMSVTDQTACPSNVLSGGNCIQWFGTNDSGQAVASGVYLWEIRSGSNHKTGKLMVVW